MCCFGLEGVRLLDDCPQEGEQLLADAALAPLQRNRRSSGAAAEIGEHGFAQSGEHRLLEAGIASGPRDDRAALQKGSAWAGSEGAILEHQISLHLRGHHVFHVHDVI